MEITDREYRELQKKADTYDDDKRFATYIIVGVCALVVTIVVVVFAWKLVSPKLNLYRSNTEKQSVIKEQEAISDAAQYEAEKKVTIATAEKEARIIDAQGLAEANKIIAASLTPEYLEYLRISNLGVAGADVIYVPVGPDGLPLAEAGRGVTTDTEDGQ